MAGRKISQVIFSTYGANAGQRAATVQITWHIHFSVLKRTENETLEWVN